MHQGIDDKDNRTSRKNGKHRAQCIPYKQGLRRPGLLYPGVQQRYQVLSLH